MPSVSVATIGNYSNLIFRLHLNIERGLGD